MSSTSGATPSQTLMQSPSSVTSRSLRKQSLALGALLLLANAACSRTMLYWGEEEAGQGVLTDAEAGVTEDVAVEVKNDVPLAEGPWVDSPAKDGPQTDVVQDVQADKVSECNPGELRCDSVTGSWVERCNVLGKWEKETQCAYPLSHCEGGVCTFTVGEGLVAFYPLDGDAKEATGSGYDGTLEGNVQWMENRAGVPVRATSIDGNSYIRVDNPLLPVGAAPRTLALWIRHPKSSTVGWQLAAAWGSSQKTKAEFALGLENGYAAFTGHFADVHYQDIKLSDAAWHSLAATYDGKVLRLHVDGSLVESKSLTLKTEGTTLVLGRDTLDEASVLAWYGGIDDVRIYNRVLTAEEILELHKEVVSQ